MEHNATHTTGTNIISNISSIDQNINDDDLVYIDNRSLKIIPSDAENINKIQESLQQQLQMSLNNAGRKSLAKRSAKQRITYKALNFLTCQINRPRTTRTLLENITKQFSSSIESLPYFVSKDMKDKGMTQPPNNIHILHLIATCPYDKMYSLPLIKHMITQCLGIDFGSSFDTLEEERLECTQVLFDSLSTFEDSQIILKCLATLSGLQDILKQQNKKNWEQLTLQQSSVPNYFKHLLSKQLINQPHESELLPIDDGANTDEEPSIAPSAEPLHSDLESMVAEGTTEKHFPFSTDEEPSIAPSAEPLHSDQESTISEEATEKAPPSPSDKTQSNDALPPLPNPALTKQTSSKSSHEAIPEERKKPTEYFIRKGEDIKNELEFHAVVAFFTKKLQNSYKIRENAVKNFINNPHSSNNNIYQNAKCSLEMGHWSADQLSELLTAATLVSNKNFFKERLDHLTEKRCFLVGQPPHNAEENRSYMVSSSKDTNNLNTGSLKYVLAKDATPTEALTSCCKDFWIADQGTLIDLAHTLTLHLFWGTTLFDKYFTQNPLTLGSFSIDHMLNSPLSKFINSIHTSKTYALGHLHTFIHHPAYPIRHPYGEYKYLYAICVEPRVPLFTAIGLFNEASIDEIYEKMVDLYNKEPRREAIIPKQQSSEPSNERNTKKDCPLSISIDDFLEGRPSAEAYVRNTLHFETALSVKKDSLAEAHKDEEIQNKHQKNKMTKRKKFRPKIYPEYSGASTGNGTDEVTQATASPFLRPETPTTEMALENDQRKTISTHINHVNKALKMCKLSLSSSEELHEVFLPFKKFYLALKDNNVALYNEYEKRYKTLEGSVQKHQ